jgi:hypothetical protein
LIQGENIGPERPDQQAYSICATLGGSILMGAIFGNVSILISNLSASSSAYHGKMEELMKVMTNLDLPNPLRRRILSYYDNIWTRYRSLNGKISMFIPELNTSLKTEVYLYIRTNLILSVPFLRHCSPDVVKELIMCLKEEVHLKGDYVVQSNETASGMFCVSHGYCQVTTSPIPNSILPKIRNIGFIGSPKIQGDTDNDNERVLKVLVDGDYFGEISLIMECRTNCSVRSATFVELCVLSRADFACALSHDSYSEDKKQMEDIIMKKYIEDQSAWAFHVRLPPHEKKASVFTTNSQSQAKVLEQLKKQVESLEIILKKVREQRTSTESPENMAYKRRIHSSSKKLRDMVELEGEDEDEED